MGEKKNLKKMNIMFYFYKNVLDWGWIECIIMNEY